MRLVNTTPLTTHVAVAARDDGTRQLSLFAKATFAFGERGGLAVLTADGAEPIRLADEETDAGVFPRDDLLADDGGFEVFFYGNAYAPGGRAVGELEVALTVDDERRTLRVFGDRVWTGDLPSTTPSVPKPFVTMPIAPRTSFGGSWMIEVDEGCSVPFFDSVNPSGKGFVVAQAARDLSEHLCADAGFPKLPAHFPLANIESPKSAVRSSEDHGVVSHWAAQKLDYTARAAGSSSNANRPKPELRRAHRDWWLARHDRLPKRVVLENLARGAHRLELGLVDEHPTVDLLSGADVSSLELRPRRLVLLPEQRRVAALFTARCVISASTRAEAVRFRWEGAES